MEFKDVLRSLRKDRNMSQAKLAEELGVSNSLIASYETGARKPSYELLEDIADYFNVSLDYLTGKDSGSVYYLDPKTAQMAQEIFKNKELCALFKAAKGAPAEVKGSDIRTIKGYPMLHIRGTKTVNADRIVPIPDELYQAIKEIPADEYIAVSQAGGRITQNTKRHVWRSYCRQINLSMGCKTYRNALVPPYPLAPDIVPYCLRHEYCTDLARKGVDVRIAQKLMGHSDIRLTANIYTNLDHDDIVEVAKILQFAALLPHQNVQKGTKKASEI